ncbi:MAG: LPS export ABC transporter periplasmic protein LptC [Candidatus Sulfotelmatobacter sp.]|jgi:lipopolysaccharide export system protein LptA
MPLPIYRLRRWLVVIAVLFTATVAGMYFYAHLRERNVLKELPNKIGIDIKQTANGFEFSKSDGKRTQFTIRASKLKQFKLDGSAELHNVSIILYGRDSSRFDQIYGDDFSYDKKTGDVTAHGEVQIDLEANPTGETGPDQGTPKELKNPIHLKTQDVVFNQNSGDAATDARVDFSTPQASGWAVGVQYSGKRNVLTLVSQVHVTLAGQHAARLFATHGTFTRDPRRVVLEHPRLERAGGTVQSDEATFFLGKENNVERVLATGNVNGETTAQDADQMRAHADEADLILASAPPSAPPSPPTSGPTSKSAGKQNLLRTGTLTGNVHVERIGSQPMQGDAGRAILDFVGQNQLQKVHAMDGVRLAQHAAGNKPPTTNASANSSPHASEAHVSEARASETHTSEPQDYDITAPVIDFFVADGHRLDHAETSGASQITISSAQNSNPPNAGNSAKTSAQSSPQHSVITAGRFEAKFAATAKGPSRLTSIHGAPDAKIVSSVPGLPDRVSTSQTLDASFLAEGGIASIVQQGSVAYNDGQPPDKRTQAWADKAHYTPADQILVLTGSPRVSDGGMVTTAKTIRINRATDDAFARGDVKSTYSDLKEQPKGALLASASPIHVTSATMTSHNSPAVALYEGNARLWQDANIVEAPSIQFDRDRRFLVAQGTAAQPVSTVLVQEKLAQPGTVQAPRSVQNDGRTPKTKGKAEEKPDDTSPVAITSARLTYADEDRIAHYEGGVVAKGTGFTASANSMDAYLRPRSQTPSNQQLATPIAGPGQLDHMIARGDVVVTQPNRRAEGKLLIYTASDDKFVLTGGPPSIFDAERGKITGGSLTFFRGDDRVLVEGEANTPVVTQTRVAKQ